jgi:pimeloyl-ACP methyl ester carboxylesterase
MSCPLLTSISIDTIERRLNRLPQFRVTIDDLDVHFIHIRGGAPRGLPIVVTHGWPSTFVELERLIWRLAYPRDYGADGADAFDVVVPSLPGFCFSPLPSDRSIQCDAVAHAWCKLMTDVLGYPRYVAHGGDLGATVTARLAAVDPARVAAIHLTSVTGSSIVRHLGDGAPPLTDAERAYLRDVDAWSETEGAYAAIQRTKPQSIALALNDSPIGLAAWIVEKYRSWSDCGGDIERRFSKDDSLTAITLYWATQTIGSSMRLYYEGRRRPWRLRPGERVETPTGVAIFPADISRPPREWGERAFNVQRWSSMPRGGHFAAHEEPDLLAAELREWFRPLRRDLS